jgi:hypothetical protein
MTTAFLGLSLVLDCYVTCRCLKTPDNMHETHIAPPALISYRLWRFHQNSTVAGSTRAMRLGTTSETLARRTLRVMIESGALQSAALLLAFIAVMLKSNVSVVTSTLVSIDISSYNQLHFPHMA